MRSSGASLKPAFGVCRRGRTPARKPAYRWSTIHGWGDAVPTGERRPVRNRVRRARKSRGRPIFLPSKTGLHPRPVPTVMPELSPAPGRPSSDLKIIDFADPPPLFEPSGAAASCTSACWHLLQHLNSGPSASCTFQLRRRCRPFSMSRAPFLAPGSTASRRYGPVLYRSCSNSHIINNRPCLQLTRRRCDLSRRPSRFLPVAEDLNPRHEVRRLQLVSSTGCPPRAAVSNRTPARNTGPRNSRSAPAS